MDDGGVENVSRPTMSIYKAKGKNTGVAVVVFPGGGYVDLAIGLEGTEVCDWLTVRGITCVVLKYRVPGSGPYWDRTCNCRKIPAVPMALQDAQRTIGMLRREAPSFGINPHKVGVLGFSAGGHLVADVSNHDGRSYTPIDAADSESSRPDFAVMLYPGHLWGEWGPPELKLNPSIQVSRKTPPTIIIQAENDPVDDVRNSLTYYMALRQWKVPVEMHLYAEGGHAFGLRRTSQPITEWPDLVEKWLHTIKMLPIEP
ncbi:MAG: alpha/beta hydrolase [Caulobacteraceae bacterium]